jgi:hypothetical protein
MIHIYNVQIHKKKKTKKKEEEESYKHYGPDLQCTISWEKKKNKLQFI